MGVAMIPNSSWIVEESKFIRDLYYRRSQEIRETERFTMIACAAIWSWSAANTNSPAIKYLMWFPVILTVVLGLRCMTIFLAMVSARKYLFKIEKQTEISGGFGWATELERQERPRSYISYIFWFLFQSLTIVVAILYGKFISFG
jgi:hypothetical protein